MPQFNHQLFKVYLVIHLHLPHVNQKSYLKLNKLVVKGKIK